MKNNIVADRDCVFLCGHIDTPNDIVKRLEDCGWINENINDKELDGLRSIYYKSFIDSLIPFTNEDPTSFYSKNHHLIKDVGKKCILRDDRFQHNEFCFDLRRFHLFGFPYDVYFLTIEIEISENTPLNDISLANSILRDINKYDILENTAPEYIDEVSVVIKNCKNDTAANKYNNLLNTGNKFKVFQIIKTETISDETIFELGTLSPIGCVSDATNNYSPSSKYFKETIENNTISVFNNWKALALVDTFTVTIKPECNTTYIWRSHYFRFIYIHVLYQKTLLFILNNRFRLSIDRKYSRQLLQDIKDQESRYAFSDISYNFLPQTIYKVMYCSLDIVSERDKLHGIIKQEVERQEAIATYRLSRALAFLTFITSLSVLYDITSLIREAMAIKNIIYYRLVIVACAISIIIGISIVLFKTNKQTKY